MTQVYTNSIESTTWHDMKPSHAPRPAFVIEAERAEAEAYDARAAAWDAWEQEYTDERMGAYMQADIVWRDALRQVYAARDAALNHTECTCTGLGDACPVCRSKSDPEAEYPY